LIYWDQSLDNLPVASTVQVLPQAATSVEAA